MRADDLEAMLFLESAGRPTVMADGTPASATGLMQIIPSTAVSLLGMRVDLARSLEINRELPRAQRRAVTSRKAKKRRAARREVRSLLRERPVVDERFDPQKSLDAAVRYLLEARRRFGRTDLAIASYHMGIGNLDTVLRTYVAPRPAPRSTRRTVERYGLSWPQLYYDSSPTRNPRTWKLLTQLGDETRHYLFKVLASREILRLAREDRDELERQVSASDGQGERGRGAAAGVALPAVRGRRRPAPRVQARRAGAAPERPGAAGLSARAQDGLALPPARAAANPLPRAAARGARHPALPREGVPANRRRGDLARHEHRARPPLPGSARADEHPGDVGVLTPHDRLRDRHREAARGGAAALPARAPAGAGTRSHGSRSRAHST